MKAKEIIIWRRLSKFLCGAEDTLRSNRIPKIHKPFIDDLLKSIDGKIKQYVETVKKN